MPLIAANLAAGAILVFAMSMLEVSDSLILAQSDEFNPITRTVFRIYSSEYAVTAEAVACALGVWAMVFLAATLIGRQRPDGQAPGGDLPGRMIVEGDHHEETVFSGDARMDGRPGGHGPRRGGGLGDR